MENRRKDSPERRRETGRTLSRKAHEFISRIKNLQGDPHYVAKGMAIGVFIGVTPTIPFHTILAVALSFVFRASKPAAAAGVWAGNPLTIPFFYFGSYKIGAYLFGISQGFDPSVSSFSELLQMGREITVAMIAGGTLLGVPFGIAAYVLTWKLFKTFRARQTRGGAGGG